MTLGPISCRGCMYSGHPHNEDCIHASIRCTRQHVEWLKIPDISWGLVTIEEIQPFINLGKIPKPNVQVLGKTVMGQIIYPVMICDINPYLLIETHTGKYRWSHKHDNLKLASWMPIPEEEFFD